MMNETFDKCFFLARGKRDKIPNLTKFDFHWRNIFADGYYPVKNWYEIKEKLL